MRQQRMKYYIEDFTEDAYRTLIQNTAKNYNYIFFNESIDRDNIVIWRHDVDFSIHRAHALATIELEEGVKSTFFIMLGGRFYNIFEKEIKTMIRDISKMGHQVGLHFDPMQYDIKTEAEFQKWLLYEKNVLSELLDVKLEAFSLHNPTLSRVNIHSEKYVNLVNAYSHKISENFKYVSDSNGYWRFERLNNVITENKHKRLHVLTHPGWWQKEPMKPNERVRRCITGRADYVYSQYEKTLAVSKRKNVK